tara:strand:- start:445 stop:990 length:546 start_codon:yes stop_codon:yes gene_type:complete
MNKNNNTGNSIKENNKCDVTIPDYETLRKEKIDKINAYYSNNLKAYTDKYREYLEKTGSDDRDLRQLADVKLKPEVIKYNKHLIKSNQELNKSLNKSTDKILKLKSELDRKLHNFSKNNNDIKNLKSNKKMMNNEIFGIDSSNKDIKEKVDVNYFNRVMIIGINIIFFIIIVLSLINLVFY